MMKFCTVGSTKRLDLQFGDRDTIAVFVAIFIAFGFVLFVEHGTQGFIIYSLSTTIVIVAVHGT